MQQSCMKPTHHPHWISPLIVAALFRAKSEASCSLSFPESDAEARIQ